MAFTIDSLGDEALTNSIIDRSITELCDEVTEEIGESALCNCTNLKKVDLHSLNKIGPDGFRNCSSLDTLILRKKLMCSLSYNALYGTPIAGGTGYVYVPSSLVSTYKGSSSWSSHVNQIRAIEDYPEVCDPYTWEMVAQTIGNGTYKNVYNVGDKIPVDLGSEGLINMQIAAFDVDTLADGSGTAAISWIGKEVLKTQKRANPAYSTNSDGTRLEGTGAIGGWEKCELRTYLQSTIKQLIPQVALGQIVSVSKTQKAVDVGGAQVTQTTSDDLWIPASPELLTSGTAEYVGLMPNNNSRKKSRAGYSTYVGWWLRDTMTSTNGFVIAKTDGSISGIQKSQDSMGVCLGFCTGRTPK